jgi:peptide/nickel transport system substrate-binding protein
VVIKFKKIWAAFYPSERYIFIGASLILCFSLILNYFLIASERTAKMPLPGGEYREGIIGQPTFINPLIAASDADRDIVSLIFSSVANLAESIKSDEDGKIWTIRLKENLYWHDGEPLTSDDVIFTIESIQDPDSNSPLFKMWQGVIAERVSVRELRLLIRTPYAFFDNNLNDLYIIPKHIFADVPPANFRLSDYNLKPIGSGPFKFKNFEKRRDGFITDFVLERNDGYFAEKPLIETMTLKFYTDENRLISAFNNRQIDGFGGVDPGNIAQIKIRRNLREIQMPRYYAIFFNAGANTALNDKNVRLALRHATDKETMLLNILDKHGTISNGPIPSYMEGYDPAIYPDNEFSLEKANEILEASGWLISED